MPVASKLIDLGCPGIKWANSPTTESFIAFACWSFFPVSANALASALDNFSVAFGSNNSPEGFGLSPSFLTILGFSWEALNRFL